MTAREDDASELTITVPGLPDPDTDLSDAELEGVSGGSGGGSYFFTQCSSCYG